MIRGEILGGRAAAERFKEAEAHLKAGMTKSVTRLCLLLQTKVKQKLSGQVLNVRTGRLRRSINLQMAGQGTLQVAGTVGTNVEYAPPHEFGFTGKVSVKESLRTQVMAFGRAIAPVSVTVRAHTRQVTLPERSFLRSSLQDMAPEIDRAFQQTIKEALK